MVIKEAKRDVFEGILQLVRDHNLEMNFRVKALQLIQYMKSVSELEKFDIYMELFENHEQNDVLRLGAVNGLVTLKLKFLPQNFKNRYFEVYKNANPTIRESCEQYFSRFFPEGLLKENF